MTCQQSRWKTQIRNRYCWIPHPAPDNKLQQKHRLGTISNTLLGAKTGFTLEQPFFTFTSFTCFRLSSGNHRIQFLSLFRCFLHITSFIFLCLLFLSLSPAGMSSSFKAVFIDQWHVVLRPPPPIQKSSILSHLTCLDFSSNFYYIVYGSSSHKQEEGK